MTEHRDLAKEHSHFDYRWEYADATARLAATGFIAGEVKLLALQLDDNSTWRLTNHSPITWLFIGGGGGVGYEVETLTYTDTANEIAGPLATDPTDVTKSNLFPIFGIPQDYVKDFTIRKVTGGSVPGYYICISPTSTAPGGGWFDGGSNPGSGIQNVLENGDKVRVAYQA